MAVALWILGSFKVCFSLSLLHVCWCTHSPEKEYVLKLTITTAVVHIPKAHVKYDIQMCTFDDGRRQGGVQLGQLSHCNFLPFGEKATEGVRIKISTAKLA